MFRFCSLGTELFATVAVTMPPWPAVAEIVDGRWEATVRDD
jgi:hypothetical protein